MKDRKIDVVLHHPDGRDEARRVTLQEADALRAGSVPFDVFDGAGTLVATFRPFPLLDDSADMVVTRWLTCDPGDGAPGRMSDFGSGKPIAFDWAHSASERETVWDWLGVPG